MLLLTKSNFQSFVRANSAAVIHFDAKWDLAGLSSLSDKIKDAQSAFSGRVAFGYVDCDENPELAKSIPVLNVPTVTYYREGRLQAVLIGARQNVSLRLERMLRGDSIEYRDSADTDDMMRFWPYV